MRSEEKQKENDWMLMINIEFLRDLASSLIKIIIMDEEKTPKKFKRVQWDEEKLMETEKDRGKFMKIDEPKTPYHRNSDVAASSFRKNNR